MTSRIQSLISSLKDLASVVSHEFRSPLARMRFSLELLETSDNADDKQRYAKEMAIDIDELDDLVKKLLTYVEFERSKTNASLNKHKILPWINDQISNTQNQNEHIQITLHKPNIRANQTAYFEDELLAKALKSIMRDTLQYSHSIVQVHIELTNKEFSIKVEGDGKGTSQKLRALLLSLSTHTTANYCLTTDRLGIGLTMVKLVCDWHNASLVIEGSPLGGISFVIRIPQIRDID